MSQEKEEKKSLREGQRRLLDDLRRIHGSEEKARKAFLYGGFGQVWGLAPRQSKHQ